MVACVLLFSEIHRIPAHRASVLPGTDAFQVERVPAWGGEPFVGVSVGCQADAALSGGIWVLWKNGDDHHLIRHLLLRNRGGVCIYRAPRGCAAALAY